MATFQSTDWRVKIEPLISGTNEYEKGPSAALRHTAIMLTDEFLRTLGHTAPRANDVWECYLYWFQTIDSVQTAMNLSEFTIGCKYWDPITLVGGDITLIQDADQVNNPGKTKMSIATVPGNIIPAGLYGFEVTFTESAQNNLGGRGWLEVFPTRPSV
jgi:hypothetical protein